MASSRNSLSTDLAAQAVLAACGACAATRIRRGCHAVVALSGGIDSIVLLHALRRTRDDGGFRLSALHIHHGLSANADRWEQFCRDVCRRWEVPLSTERVEVERNSYDGLEAAARRARHEVFRRTEADLVVLGHHRGDQAETVLFNLLRGCGVAGAAAMEPWQTRLLRPLLAVSRADIEAYAAAFHLDWVDDESNRDIAFSRNYLRHEVLRRIKDRFPAAEKNIAAAAARFREAADLLDDLARADLAGADCVDFPVAIPVLAALSEPRARNALRYLLAARKVAIPSEARLHEALRQMLTAAPDRHPRVRLGAWALVRRRGRVDLEPIA